MKTNLYYIILIIPIFCLTLDRLPACSGEKGIDQDCLNAAIRMTIEIKSLPEKEFLKTLDGQHVLLTDFSERCMSFTPWCSYFNKFYYWKSAIKEIISHTDHGRIKHKIRCYYNCISTCCSFHSDALKIHGDVVEYYDEEGDFMGIAVYMGGGKYFPLPYSNYRK